MFLGINEVCTMRARSEAGLFVSAIRVRWVICPGTCLVHTQQAAEKRQAKYGCFS